MLNKLDHDQNRENQKSFLTRHSSVLSLNALYWYIRHLSDVIVDEESMENLLIMDKNLATTSMVAIGYHPSKGDIDMIVLLKNALENLRKMLLPAAISHNEGVEGFLLKSFGKAVGVEFLSIVRPKDIENAKSDKRRKVLEAKKPILKKELVRVTKENMTEAGVVYAVSPPSQRAKILIPKDVKSGFVGVAEKTDSPIGTFALIRDKKNRRVFKVGKMMPPPQPGSNRDEEVFKYMHALAMLLPEDRRGGYH